MKGVTKIAKPSGSLERKEKPKEDGTVEAEKKTTVGVVSPIVKRHGNLLLNCPIYLANYFNCEVLQSNMLQQRPNPL